MTRYEKELRKDLALVTKRLDALECDYADAFFNGTVKGTKLDKEYSMLSKAEYQLKLELIALTR